jgi:hypothetical protein
MIPERKEFDALKIYSRNAERLKEHKRRQREAKHAKQT